MKKVLLICILIGLPLMLISEEEKLNDSKIPLYEKVSILKDYRINQPIKEAIRWGSAGFAISYFGSLNFLEMNKKYYDIESSEISHEAFQAAWETGKLSMLIGGIYGIYEGFKMNNSLKGWDYHQTIKDKFGYEFGLMVDPFLEKDLKTKLSVLITCSQQFWILNEYELGVCWVRWPDLDDRKYVYEERKYILQGKKYFRNNKFLSPYYGIGLGISYGTRRHNEAEYFDDSKIVSEGIYPFIKSSAGIKFNFFDFFYIKIETDFELSSYFYYVNSYEDYNYLSNLTFGMKLGTKIF